MGRLIESVWPILKRYVTAQGVEDQYTTARETEHEPGMVTGYVDDTDVVRRIVEASDRWSWM